MSASKYVALGCMAWALSLATASAHADVTHTTSNLNLRAGPGTNYPVKTVIPAGAPIDVQSCGHVWCYAEWASQLGYVNRDYLLHHVTVQVHQITHVTTVRHHTVF